MKNGSTTSVVRDSLPSDEGLLNRKQVCLYLNISDSTFLRMRHRKELPNPDLTLKRGGRWRKSSLDAHLARARKGG